MLEQHWMALATKLSIMRQYTQKTTQSTQQSQKEHAAMITALQEKSPETLISLLKDHAFNQYRFVSENL